MYMNMKNDVAFLLDNRLSLYEHELYLQSEYAAARLILCIQDVLRAW